MSERDDFEIFPIVLEELKLLVFAPNWEIVICSVEENKELRSFSSSSETNCFWSFTVLL